MKREDNKFKLVSNWPPAGDQPKAISELVKGLEEENLQRQTLLGVTGSGKTFTIANVIEKTQKPTLVIAHNKTLAAQLAQEFKEFFPNNKVHYFVSYYDYYQPEAYVSATDTYIEKDASINEEIDRLRHASTQSLLTRNDVIIVASVSCIYGLGSPEEYFKENLFLKIGQKWDKLSLMEKLVELHFERTNADLKNGTFRAVGNRVDINPMHENWMASIFFANGEISVIQILDPVSMRLLEEVQEIMFFPAKHFVTSEDSLKKALLNIQKELDDQVKKFDQEGKLLEADRIKRRTMQDIAMMREVGYCSGIENYSRHLSGKKVGEAPETLISYFPKNEKGERDFLTIIDESHVTLPQLHAMYAGDRARKENLVKFGFRLPSALDNRPLRYEEFKEKVNQIIYVSATPSDREIEESQKVVEQIIRPTGLIDPKLEIKPVLPTKKDGTILSKINLIKENLLQVKYTENIGKFSYRVDKDFLERKGVCCIIKDNKTGEYLYVKYLKNNLKTPLTGGVNENETLEECVIREIKEETGFINLKIKQNCGKFLFKFFSDEVPKNMHYELDVFEVEILNYKKVEVSEDEKNKQVFEFCKKEDLISNINISGFKFLLEEYFKFKNKANKNIDKNDFNYPGQVEDFIEQTEIEVKKGGRVICTTLTKKMAEDLSNFLKDRKIKAEYLHSDIKTIERIQILTRFRKGEFDCLVGVNLLREGLDLPEVTLIGIFDADKEGFLRSETSLVQTIGRAARNAAGRVILYADIVTGSLERAIKETERRRKIQEEYNAKNGITPKTILKSINDITKGMESLHKKAADTALDTEIKLGGKKLSTLLNKKEKEMKIAAKDLDFETAAILRDEIKKLNKMIEDKKDKTDRIKNNKV